LLSATYFVPGRMSDYGLTISQPLGSLQERAQDRLDSDSWGALAPHLPHPLPPRTVDAALHTARTCLPPPIPTHLQHTTSAQDWDTPHTSMHHTPFASHTFPSSWMVHAPTHTHTHTATHTHTHTHTHTPPFTHTPHTHTHTPHTHDLHLHTWQKNCLLVCLHLHTHTRHTHLHHTHTFACTTHTHLPPFSPYPFSAPCLPHAALPGTYTFAHSPATGLLPYVTIPLPSHAGTFGRRSTALSHLYARRSILLSRRYDTTITPFSAVRTKRTLLDTFARLHAHTNTHHHPPPHSNADFRGPTAPWRLLSQRYTFAIFNESSS